MESINIVDNSKDNYTSDISEKRPQSKAKIEFKEKVRNSENKIEFKDTVENSENKTEFREKEENWENKIESKDKGENSEKVTLSDNHSEAENTLGNQSQTLSQTIFWNTQKTNRCLKTHWRFW